MLAFTFSFSADGMRIGRHGDRASESAFERHIPGALMHVAWPNARTAMPARWEGWRSVSGKLLVDDWTLQNAGELLHRAALR
jgi:hypothetical protein